LWLLLVVVSAASGIVGILKWGTVAACGLRLAAPTACLPPSPLLPSSSYRSLWKNWCIEYVLIMGVDVER
jgi:hypothetical protein